DQLIATNKATLDSILSRLHPTLNEIAARETDINQILAALGPGVNTMALSVAHGPWQDVYIKTIGFDVLGCVNALKGTPDGTPLDQLCAPPHKRWGTLKRRGGAGGGGGGGGENSPAVPWERAAKGQRPPSWPPSCAPACCRAASSAELPARSSTP